METKGQVTQGQVDNETTCNATNVVNLSDSPLTPSEVSLLSKGLSFDPTFHFDAFSTILDVNMFVRNILLKKHFSTTFDTPVPAPF